MNSFEVLASATQNEEPSHKPIFLFLHGEYSTIDNLHLELKCISKYERKEIHSGFVVGRISPANVDTSSLRCFVSVSCGRPWSTWGQES